MEYYEEILGKKRQSMIYAIVSLIVPLVLGFTICMVERKIDPEYNFYILDIFYYAAPLLMFYIIVKPITKAVRTWRFKGVFVVLLALGAFFEIAKMLDSKHTHLYNIAVPGLCENMEYAILYILFSLLLFIVYLLKFIYYGVLAKKYTN